LRRRHGPRLPARAAHQTTSAPCWRGIPA